MEPHIVNPTSQHTHTIIFLHGRDSTATEFASEFFESRASDGRTFTAIFPSIKWVFPTSRLRSSARFNTEMSQWFDMWSVENPLERKDIQRKGLLESVQEILEVIHREKAFVPFNRIVLAGISQGCATAIFCLLLNDMHIGAFIGLSSWLPFSDDLSRVAPTSQRLQEIRNIFQIDPDHTDGIESLSRHEPGNVSGPGQSSGAMFQTPLFLAHSRDDGVVPVANGRDLERTLRGLGFLDLEWREYEDGGHWINEPRGVDDIVSFLRSHLDVLVL